MGLAGLGDLAAVAPGGGRALGEVPTSPSGTNGLTGVLVPAGVVEGDPAGMGGKGMLGVGTSAS